MKYHLILLTIIGFICSFSASGQETVPDHNAPLLFDMYQLYMPADVSSVISIKYEKESKPLKGRLAVNKDIIILDNYDGKNRVEVKYKDYSGETITFFKSRCHIDPYSPL